MFTTCLCHTAVASNVLSFYMICAIGPHKWTIFKPTLIRTVANDRGTEINDSEFHFMFNKKKITHYDTQNPFWLVVEIIFFNSNKWSKTQEYQRQRKQMIGKWLRLPNKEKQTNKQAARACYGQTMRNPKTAIVLPKWHQYLGNHDGKRQTEKKTQKSRNLSAQRAPFRKMLCAHFHINFE